MTTAYRPGGLRRVGTYCDGQDHTELVKLRRLPLTPVRTQMIRPRETRAVGMISRR